MSGPLQLALGTPTHLHYGSGVRRDLQLLEVDEAVLKELQAAGGSIKGGSAADEAVLCTRERTYALKHVQTTNTVLLMPPTPQAAEAQANGWGPVVAVGGEAGHHMEAVLAAPRLGTLHALLPVYDGEEQENGMMSGGDSPPREVSANDAGPAPLTFEQLLDRVQASEAELRAALQQTGALELDGRWHRLAPDLLGTILEVLLLSATQHGWGRDAIRSDAAAEALQADGFDPRVVRHCLGLVSGPVTAAGEPDDSSAPQLWRLNDQKVALHFAQKLLRQQPSWKRPEFLAAWRDVLPEGIEADEGVLRGVAISEAEDRLRYFPADALPTAPAERFAALFAARRRWAAGDIGPYLEGMQAPGQSKEALLLRDATPPHAE